MSNTADTKEMLLQWIKGDKTGNIERITGQDSEWTLFESGSRISTVLINEFMLPVEGEPLDLNLPQPTLGQTISSNDSNKSTSNKRATSTQRDNPIKTLFDKQKKTDKVDLKLTFSVSVPSKDIFDIINMTFDEDEVLMELDSFISNQIDETILKDTLRTSIEELIKSKYKGKKN